MSRADLATYFDPEQGHTDWIEDFISRKGRPFTARLVRQENGRHTFEFKPRAAGAGKKKGAKKKVGKKKSAKKKTATEDAGE
jgi:DNA topoisomerase-3